MEQFALPISAPAVVFNTLRFREGEKKEEKEEKKKDYYLSERRYKGLLTVTLPKTAAAQAAEKLMLEAPFSRQSMLPYDCMSFNRFRRSGYDDVVLSSDLF